MFERNETLRVDSFDRDCLLKRNLYIIFFTILKYKDFYYWNYMWLYILIKLLTVYIYSDINKPRINRNFKFSDKN